MHVLYLTNKSEVSLGATVLAAAFANPDAVTKTDSFEDASSMLLQQDRGDHYAFNALVADDEVDNGLKDLWRLRNVRIRVPIVVLTCRKPIAPLRAKYLDAGADHCLPARRLTSGELRSTVCAAIRRAYGFYERLVAFHCLELDQVRRAISCNGEPLRLRPREYILLEALILHKGHIVPHARLFTIFETVPAEPYIDYSVIAGGIAAKLKSADANVMVRSDRESGLWLERR
jgi:DNA-binding response OmpR family regulator